MFVLCGSAFADGRLSPGVQAANSSLCIDGYDLVVLERTTGDPATGPIATLSAYTSAARAWPIVRRLADPF